MSGRTRARPLHRLARPRRRADDGRTGGSLQASCPRRWCKPNEGGGDGAVTFLTVLRRELRAFLALPQTYAIAAAFFVISGVFFVSLMVSTEVPDLNQYYSNVAST